MEHPASPPRHLRSCPCNTRWRRTPTAARPSGWASWNCAQRMRWAVGYTLRPGKAYLEAAVRIVNRTPVVEHHALLRQRRRARQRELPGHLPAQHAVRHLSQQEPVHQLAASPTAGTTVRTSPRASISVGTRTTSPRIRSSPGTTRTISSPATTTAAKAGIMTVADHHVVPGKKLWTWGNGPPAAQWDHILTDDDGPYIELMVGAYSDNQPDYSWLQPYEAKSFSMYWYPFRDIGGVKKANLDAAVNLDVAAGKATLRLLRDLQSRRRHRPAQGRRQGPAGGKSRHRARQALLASRCRCPPASTSTTCARRSRSTARNWWPTRRFA